MRNYEIVFHCNRLVWDFPDARMKETFEANQYWRKVMPAGHQGVPAGTFLRIGAAQGIPSTMNRIVLKDGMPVLDAFPSWAWNQAGNVRVLQLVLGYEIDEYNRMWLLDQGKIAYAPSPERSQKLIVLDLDTNRLLGEALSPPLGTSPARP